MKTIFIGICVKVKFQIKVKREIKVKKEKGDKEAKQKRNIKFQIEFGKSRCDLKEKQ